MAWFGMAGGEEWSIESPWMFRDKKYLVSADVREDVLVLQVEERLTADRWRGQFEPKRECSCWMQWAFHFQCKLCLQLLWFNIAITTALSLLVRAMAYEQGWPGSYNNYVNNNNADSQLSWSRKVFLATLLQIISLFCRQLVSWASL